MIYLDPLSKYTGGLRVIPSTHRRHGSDLLAALRRGDQGQDFRPSEMRAERDRLGGVGDGAGRRPGLHRTVDHEDGLEAASADTKYARTSWRTQRQNATPRKSSNSTLRPHGRCDRHRKPPAPDPPDRAKATNGNSRSSIPNLHSPPPPSIRQRMGYSDTLGIKRPPQPRQGTNPIQYE